jgi:DNA-binding transcriptional MerR regulator
MVMSDGSRGVYMSTHYQIGEFAELGGVSAKTLRFYDDIGVLRPASVDPRTGYRRYLPQQLEDLASILALKNLGVPLSRLRELIGKKGSAAERRAVLKELKQTIELSIETATQSLHWINAALDELDERHAPISVVVKRRPAIAVASLRVNLKSYAEVSEFEQELSRIVPPECVGTLRGVLWHRCADSGSLEAEPFLALNTPLPSRLSCEVKQPPQAVLACAYSADDNDSAEEAYATIRRWMNVRGYRVEGPKRELYLGEMLEIQFPLARN